jgi:hypothetical protein
MARKTTTGLVFEQSVALALQHGGFHTMFQQHVGNRLGGGKHMVDIVATKGSQKILVSLKWQQTSGTAEQKVPYEFLCLASAVQQDPTVSGAYLVLGGNGWTKREFFVNDLATWISGTHEVQVIEGNDFIAAANQGKL